MKKNNTIAHNHHTHNDFNVFLHLQQCRYLPSNAVLSLHVDRSRKSGHSLLVFTETGAAYLDVRPFSLKEKAAAMDTFQ